MVPVPVVLVCASAKRKKLSARLTMTKKRGAFGFMAGFGLERTVTGAEGAGFPGDRPKGLDCAGPEYPKRPVAIIPH